MNIIIDNEKFIDSEEVADRLDIALSTLKVKVRAKEIPLPIKLKTYTFWRESDIETYLEDHKKDKAWHTTSGWYTLHCIVDSTEGVHVNF